MAGSISPGGSFVDTRCVGCVANFTAGGKDTCTLTFARDSTAASDFTFDEEASVTLDGGTLFTGIVSLPARSARGTGEYHTVTLGTKWQRLERIPYTQVYASGPSSTARKSRCMIGVTESGTRMTIAEIIAEVLAYANSEGADIPVGSILPGDTTYPPVVETVDALCSEVIRSVLAWAPDAVVFFDHDSGELNIIRQGDLGAVSRVAGAADRAVEAQVFPRGDILLRGVQIHYEKTTTVDGVEYNQTVIDGAGASTGQQVVHLTLPLEGANITTQSQVIKTRDIPTGHTDAGLVQWMLDHFPELKAAAPGAGQLAFADPVQVVHTDEEVGPGTTLTEYPRELLKGQIRDFMTGISACPVTWKIKVKYVAAASANPALYKLFSKAEKIEEFAVTIMGTDAMDQTYSTVSSEGGEEVPEGLAAAFFAAFTSAAEEGTYTRIGGADLDLRPSKKLTISGRVSATGSPIQSCSIDGFSGRTSCSFGPLNAALSPGDWLQLQRAGERTRKPTTKPYNSRAVAARGGSEKIKGATGGRLHNSTRTTGGDDSGYLHCSLGVSGKIVVAAGVAATAQWPVSIIATSPVPTAAIRQLTIAGATLDAGAGNKIWVKGTWEQKEYGEDGGVKGRVWDLSAAELIVSSSPTNTATVGHVLIAEIAEGPDGERVINQRHRGLLVLPSLSATIPAAPGAAPAATLRAFQTVVRENPGGSGWQVWITSGVVQGASFVVYPTMMPGATAMSGADAYYFDEVIEGTDASADDRQVWLKLIIDDGDPYDGAMTSGEIHLRTVIPSTKFSPGAYQWVLLGTVYSDGDGILFPTSHVRGSLIAQRNGGPGCYYHVYTA